MTKHTIVAVGLNVGPCEPVNQLNDTLEQLAWVGGYRGFARGLTFALGESEWEGVAERFVQAALPTVVKDNYLAVVSRLLQQTCVSVLRPGADQWALVYADGRVEAGGSLQEYPVLIPGVRSKRAA